MAGASVGCEVRRYSTRKGVALCGKVDRGAADGRRFEGEAAGLAGLRRAASQGWTRARAAAPLAWGALEPEDLLGDGEGARARGGWLLTDAPEVRELDGRGERAMACAAAGVELARMHAGSEASGAQWTAAGLTAAARAEAERGGGDGEGEAEAEGREADEAEARARAAERDAEAARKRRQREAEERWARLSPGQREEEEGEGEERGGGKKGKDARADAEAGAWTGGWGWDADTRLHTVWQRGGACREAGGDWFAYFHARRLEPLCAALRDEEMARLCTRVLGRLDRYLDPRLAVRPALLHGHACLANVAGTRGDAPAPLLLAPASWYGHGELDLGALWRAEASSPGGEAWRCAREMRTAYWDARGEVPGEAEDDRAAMYRLYHALALVVAQERGSRGGPDLATRDVVLRMLRRYA